MSEINWSDILEQRFLSYKAEVTAFLDTVHISNSTDVSIEKIYDKIKDDEDVPENLKLLYKECISGTDKNVKLRMHNHIGNFKRGLRLVLGYCVQIQSVDFTHCILLVCIFSHLLIICFMNFRGLLKVRDMDMMHASDYSNMSVEQLQKEMNENKKKDDKYAKGLQCVSQNFFRYDSFIFLTLSLFYLSYLLFREEANRKRKLKMAGE